MKKEARKHHYVPRSILRNFTIDGTGKRLFVFDKHENRSFAASVENTAAERDFYRVQLGDQDLNYESGFQDLDDRLATLVAKLVKEKSLTKLEAGELRDIPILVACQRIRTNLQRSTPIEITRLLENEYRYHGLPAPKSINDADARQIAFYQFLFRMEQYTEWIRKKDIILLIPREERLWTSDEPVVLNNFLPDGELGLMSPGIEIYYPLSPDLCLAFYCRSIRQILSESIDPNHPRPSPKLPILYEQHKALVGQGTLEIPEDFSAYLNTLQIYQSSRFLYSNKDEFEQVRGILSQDPLVRNPRPCISLRQSKIPPAPNLLGTWLVAYKSDREFALQIEFVDKESNFIDFKTTDKTKVEDMFQFTPFDAVILYQDGKSTWCIREALLVPIEQGGNHCFRVQHSDPSQNELLENVYRRQKDQEE